jgi:hypothetical protein
MTHFINPFYRFFGTSLTHPDPDEPKSEQEHHAIYWRLDTNISSEAKEGRL